ncbi:hypothetical protein PAPYR_9727 [Paratrimastix pyriformis]|uniref:Uncharacterized protein n=1 Tax=Paratrimastix pyriformis TaxID=342808 RepID=A0ABQ8U7L6_9EUKA|nr:hypothetical protein PAPYR_9727 [Paratrimastix pyriformis]
MGPQVTIIDATGNAPGTGLLEALPPSVRRLWLGLKLLRLAPTVTRLALTQANCPETTRLSGPGLRTLELGGSAMRSLDLDTPLLAELVVAEGFPTITSRAPLHRLAALRGPNAMDEVKALFAFLRGPVGQTLNDLSFRSPGILDPPPIIELPVLRSLRIALASVSSSPAPSTHALLLCPALERLSCGGQVWIQSVCPFLGRIGQNAPLPYWVSAYGELNVVPPLPSEAGPLPLPAEPTTRTDDNAGRDVMVVLLTCSNGGAPTTRDESPKFPSAGPAVRTVMLEDATPSRLLAHLVAYRPDVLLLECPSTRDALILRTPQTPRLRAMQASDLLAIFAQAGFAPLAVLHRLPFGASGCLPPDIFLHSLWTALRDGRRLVGHFEGSQALDQYLHALGNGDVSRPGAALTALTQSYVAPQWLAYAGHRPAVPTTTDLVQSTRSLQAHFPGVRLRDLAGAVRQRDHEFRRPWPTSRLQFHQGWACQECSRMACALSDTRPVLSPTKMRLFEPALVLPDFETRLSCPLILQSAATRMLADVPLHRASYQPEEAPALCRQALPSKQPPLRVVVVTSESKDAEQRGVKLRPAERRELRIDPCWGNLLVSTVVLSEASPASVQATVEALAETRPNVLVFMATISARQDFLSALSPRELQHCIDRACPNRLPRLVAVLGLPHAVDTGRFLQRHLRPDAPAGGGGLERVVASADGATDTEVSMFLSALLAYLPCNSPEDLDEVLEVARRQAARFVEQQHLRVLIRVAPCRDEPADSIELVC